MARIVKWKVQGIGDASERMITDNIIQVCHNEVECGCCWDIAFVIESFRQAHPDVLVFKAECWGPVDLNLN